MDTPWRKPAHHYVSHFNFAPGIARDIKVGPDERVQLYDSTLRKSLMVPGGKVSPAGQAQLAEALVDVGVSGFFYNFYYDRKILKESARAQENQKGSAAAARAAPGLRKIASLYAFPKNFSRDDACRLALEAGMDVLEPGVPASDIEREADVPGTSREQLIGKMCEAIAFCKGLGAAVTANLTDVGRADEPYIIEMANAAISAGATEIRLTDSYGAMSPEAVRYVCRKVREGLAKPVPLMVHFHDDYGLATANAIAAALEGARVETTVNGLGDKGGFAATEEVALALEVLYNVRTGIKLEKLQSLSDLAVKLTGIPREPLKAVVGSDIFHVEGDSTVARLFKGEVSVDDPGARLVARTYEPSIVGRQHRRVWGRTTLAGGALREKLRALNLSCSDERIDRINEEIRRRLNAKRRYPCWLEEEEVESICRKIASE